MNGNMEAVWKKTGEPVGFWARLIEPRKQCVDHTKLMFTNQQLKALLVSLIFEQILNMMVGMIDTAMVSHAGELAVSGVSLVDMLNGVFIYLFSALATGGAVVVSQLLGYGDEKLVKRASSQLVSAAAFFGIMLMLGILAGNRVLLQFLFGQVEEGVMDAALTYLVITVFSLPFIAVYNAAAALFRSMGNSKITMKVSVLMNGMNIVGNGIGIFVLHADVVGVAVASVLSRIAAAAVLLVLLADEKRRISICLKDIFSFDGKLLRKILGIAIPNGVESGMFQICRVTMTSIIATFGTAQIAANGVACSIDNINTIINSATTLALPVVIGRCVGANDYDQADYYLRKMLRITAICSAVLCTGLIALLPLIMKVYNLSDEAVRYVYILVIFHGILTIIMGWPSGPFPAALRAAGDVRWPMYVSLLSLTVGRLFFSYVFALWMNFEIIGMWMAMATHWSMNAVGAYIHYRSGKWKNYRIVS